MGLIAVVPVAAVAGLVLMGWDRRSPDNDLQAAAS